VGIVIAVFDTNIVIDALNGVVGARDEYERYDRALISRITWIEALVGAAAEDTLIRAFLSDFFLTTPLDLRVAEVAVELRREHRLKLPDCIVWATALANDAVLVTRNTRDFPADAEGIRIPYEL
jgi:predicted nucleic acid-binding protein